jgi:LmbE family N-acetylglucosaminyl deacetylase
MHVLAIGAHPDDCDIGCGGTLALHAEARDRVTICCATDGGAGAVDIPAAELSPIRRRETAAAAAKLGAAEVRFLDFSDGRLAYAGYDLVLAVGRLVREQKPSIVYTHHAGDAHPDHAALATAVIDAIRRAGTPYFQELGPVPHQVGDLRLFEVWTPLPDVAHTVDISSEADRKAAAIRCHATQLERYAYDEIALGLNRYRTVHLRTARFVEAFGTARTTW